ncbi:MAG TPA: tetratricopeptide repeat protein [Candidatus Paceibacterota bacterium]|nr:tetratricopeptide repeat protein [Candidatus Paceibacterota bacterium]
MISHARNQKVTIAALAAAAIILFAPAAISSVYLKLGQYYQGQIFYETRAEHFDLAKAIGNYEMALWWNPNNELAQYNLANAYFSSGNHIIAEQIADEYLLKYPERKRMHYVRGLIHGDRGKFEEAKADFEEFLSSGLTGWPGFLDLAWVEFKEGSYARAEATLRAGLELFPDNPWLNTSLGAVLINQKKSEEARDVLTRAKVKAQLLDLDAWALAYPSNNPNHFPQELQAFQDIIDYNLALASGEDVALGDAQSILYLAPYAALSPRGEASGLVVSACGNSEPRGGGNDNGGCTRVCRGRNQDTCTTQCPNNNNNRSTCESAPNICGMTNEGRTRNGVCDATTPPNSECCASAPNACGQINYAQPNSRGQCGTVAPPSSASCPAPTVSQFYADPDLVRKNDTARLFWSSTSSGGSGSGGGAGSSGSGPRCSITGGGLNRTNLPAQGSISTLPITARTAYTLTCRNVANGPAATRQTTVNIIPVFREI